MQTDQTSSSNLARLRQAKGIALETIEFSTRIGLHFLEAIEAEDFGSLPGGVYNVSYLRQYARASGCDESALLTRYYDRMEPKPTPEPPQNRVARCLVPLRNLFDRYN